MDFILLLRHFCYFTFHSYRKRFHLVPGKPNSHEKFRRNKFLVSKNNQEVKFLGPAETFDRVDQKFECFAEKIRDLNQKLFGFASWPQLLIELSFFIKFRGRTSLMFFELEPVEFEPRSKQSPENSSVLTMIPLWLNIKLKFELLFIK